MSFDKFLRDLDRVCALGRIFEPERPPATFREVRPGVFVSDGKPPAPVSPLGRLREQLKRGDRVAHEAGRRLRREMP